MLQPPWRDGASHLKFTPLEFQRRVAALVPRPQSHTEGGNRLTFEVLGLRN